MPLLPWRALHLIRSPKIAIVILIIAIVVSSVLDHQAYQGPEWSDFKVTPILGRFTDFGAGELLKQRPDILERYGYSSNDLDLITAWFFIDPNIAN
ncbi:MAG: hypothetical protein ACRESZ_00710, partial [Methylococcales bacterium]